MSEEMTKELAELRERILRKEEIYAIVSQYPENSRAKDWFSERDEYFRGKVVSIESCHYSVSEAIKIQVLHKNLQKSKTEKYLHYKDLEIISKEYAEELQSTVFHFNPEALAV